MQLNKLIQRDYTSFSPYYQLKLPLDIEISIPSSELSHINEITFYAISNNEMEYSEIKINL